MARPLGNRPAGKPNSSLSRTSSRCWRSGRGI